MTKAEQYNQFIKAIEFDEIVLSELNAKKHNDPEEGQWSAEINPEFSLIEKNDKKIKAMVVFDVKVISKHQSNITILFSISAKFILTYNILEAIIITDEIIERFINTNVPLNGWPYGREIISSMSTKMGFPPLLIGTFKVI